MLKWVPRPLNSGTSTTLSQRNIFSDQWADPLHSNQSAMSKCARGMKGAFHNECGYSGCLEHGATEALAASGRIRVTALTTPAIKDEKKKKNKPAEIARTFGDLYHNTPSWTTSPTETSLKQNAICTRVYNSGLKPRTLEGLRYTKFSESRLQRILPFYELFINASLKIEWKVVASKFTSSASFNTDYNNRWKQER